MQNAIPTTDPRPQNSMRRAVATATGVIAACLIAAGCATHSSSGHTPTSPTTGAAAVAFSECMRAHGLHEFPDPGARIIGPSSSIGGIEIPAAIDMQSPAFQTAQDACRGLLSAVLSPSGKPSITAGVKAALIAKAQCMRTHGVPTYQDPTFPARGGIAVTDSGTNPQSPAYRQAELTCGNG